MPQHDPRVTNLSYMTVDKVLAKISQITPTDFANEFSKSGDVGTTIANLIEKSKGSIQATLVTPEKSISEIYDALISIAEAEGTGSRAKKERILEVLLSQASALEAKYIVKNLIGEMRHGFSEGLMEATLASIHNISESEIRHAHMLLGDLGELGNLLLTKGSSVLREIRPIIFKPLRPMLAETATNTREAMKAHNGISSFEFKIDGARVQIHKRNDEVKLFSRRLSDVTQSLPDLVEHIRQNLVTSELIVEGEVVGVDTQGRPLPFQFLMRRFRRVKDVENSIREIPVELYVFDLLYLDGKSYLDLPLSERRSQLSKIRGNIKLVPELTTAKDDDARKFFAAALKAGHEGLMAKHPKSDYTPGSRGKKWLKIKTVETLDLVIIGAEYGTGYRHKWLSDYYLGVLDTANNRFEMIGKTFKGLTDAEIEQITKKLLSLEEGRTGRAIIVRPEVVVEVGFSEIQKSSTYECGFALRFARINRFRDDKQPYEADTLNRVKELFDRQFESKGKLPMEL